MHTIPYVNDSSGNAPKLEHHINLFSITGIPALFNAPRMSLFGLSREDYARIKHDGFEGVQSHVMLAPSLKKCEEASLEISAAGIVKPHQLESKANKWKLQGYNCATIMIGSGKETNRESLGIAKQVIETSRKLDFPIYLELHRGTVTQDISTVLAMIKAYPGLKFNGDFSHYILSYRWLETFTVDTLKRIRPILERIAYLHLRPADSQHIQLAECNEQSLALYKLLLQSVFSFFKKNAANGDKLIATPELLPTITGYNDLIKSPMGHQDLADRYQQSQWLKSLAIDWFDEVSIQQLKPIALSHLFINTGNLSLSSPIITINEISDWTSLQQPNLKFANHIRILLGNGLDSPEAQESLIHSYLIEQEHDRRICLETHRNTVTHTIDQTLALQERFPGIRLCLNLAEWVLGEEITVDQIPKTKRKIKKLDNIIALNPIFATAEHTYNGLAKYCWKAFRQNSVIMERLYTRFYTKQWDRICAHRLSDYHQPTDRNAHQAILYAREKYQKA